jgi:DNA-binding transcriptional ArsR family regulator
MEMTMAGALQALDALGQETRLALFRRLVRAGAEGLPAGALADALGVAAPTLSFHLKELRHAGLVRVEREGRSLRYRPDFAAMTALLGFLTENCCVDVARCAPPSRRPSESRPRARARRAH